MAILDTLSRRARSAVDDLRAAWAASPPDSNAASAFGDAHTEAQEMFSIIEARLAEAREMAAARGDRPTLEDYRQACVAFGNTPEGLALATPDDAHPNGRWTPQAYANLGGQLGQGPTARGHNLSGFALSEPQKRVMSDLLDLDSDGAIGTFYTNIDFTGANLNNAYVDPATSFNEEIAKAKNLKGLTFNNMAEGDTFTFGAGHYEDVRMTNIRGGEIIFGDHTRVDGVTIDGISASLAMGDRATVNNVVVNDHFRIMNLAMGEGSVLTNSDLSSATISMASRFDEGATFQNVQLGSNVAGLDFSGLTLNNVSIGGRPIERASDLAQFGIGYDSDTVASASPDMVRAYQLAQIRDTMQQAVASIGKESAPEAPAIGTAKTLTNTLAEANPNDSLAQSARTKEVADVNAANFGNDPIAAARAVALQLGIVGGASVNLSDVGLTTQVASLERTVPVEEQASGANMNRNLPGAKGDA